MTPCFAIIDSNTLSRMSLQGMLKEIYDQVEIYCYSNIIEFIRDSNRHFVHFFVSADILFADADEFETLKPQTTVICQGHGEAFARAGFRTVDSTMPEQEIIAALLELDENLKRKSDNGISMTDRLSPREKEVLILIVKGFINKEIAQQLKISTPTAIFHRNNICEKLQTRSIGKLTVYAVLSGLVDLKEI